MITKSIKSPSKSVLRNFDKWNIKSRTFPYTWFLISIDLLVIERRKVRIIAVFELTSDKSCFGASALRFSFFSDNSLVSDVSNDFQKKSVLKITFEQIEDMMRNNMGKGLPIEGFFEMKQEIYEIAIKQSKHRK